MTNVATQTNREGLHGLPDSDTLQNPKTAQKRAAESANSIALPMVIASWPKNSRETLQVQLSEYQGRKVIDCRTWYLNADGELRPSSKGMTLAVSHLPALADAIVKALATARHHGFVDSPGGKT